MSYHFAFLAISVALFGMTLGSILVYQFPRFFTDERSYFHLALSALFFAITLVLSFLTYIVTPFYIHLSFVGIYYIVFTFMNLLIPFVFSGICISLAITKFSTKVSRLYAADLSGAAMGCLFVLWILNITDGPTAIIGVGFLVCIGAFYFAILANSESLKKIIIFWGIIFGLFTATHTVLVQMQKPILRLLWIKASFNQPTIYEKWNSYSRIHVWGEPEKPQSPFGWGFSSTLPPKYKIRELYMKIDASAATVLTHFDNNLSKLEYLKYDITNVVHYLKQDAKVLVIGSGGGRDILSALVFNQKSVLGVEINKAIIDAVNKKYGDFTGHLDRHPKVTFINDEARSYIAREKAKFDIIQVSFIDTWAATAAGAYVLTENALYTTEAWKIFLEHLNENGILTFSRYYFRDRPCSIYRLTSLATKALIELGVRNPRKHIMIVRQFSDERIKNVPDGIGTVLINRDPFSEKDLTIMKQIADTKQFDLVMTPELTIDSTFAIISSVKDRDQFINQYPLNIAAPTDDSPFFFHMLRLQDIFNRELLQQGPLRTNMKAIIILGVLLSIVVFLTILCIIVPLLLTTARKIIYKASPLFLLFAVIGFGFMLIEISQMQRLIIYLGHPVYGLSVVLFALLLSSGLGSYSTQKVNIDHLKASGLIRILSLLVLIFIFGKLTPYVITTTQSYTTIFRIIIAILQLIPLGFFMGMVFPLGIKISSKKAAILTPWLYGINGATSVCASVIAVVIAINWGISKCFWSGFYCYTVALIAFLLSCPRIKEQS
ncbi:hypothetical protein JW979_05260 [bacterium]|nr:hypothetical protein [candidate division CSSED10-310 bacterium]